MSAILIVIGFTSELGFKNEAVAISTLVLASILGALPIAIQAYQALKVKVVSIDVLVTIAVVGAFSSEILKNPPLSHSCSYSALF